VRRPPGEGADSTGRKRHADKQPVADDCTPAQSGATSTAKTATDSLRRRQ
jgi:hypothetical protein